ncbi:polyprenyl synthetase family protein [Streptomyces albofaciens]|uniref:polyprenyl synthetase family protein n=1 Tax=Streptomyces albofaciens TaxID=66866 RepID=UPI001FCB9463|nr:polyprenyl synthetase family protein [Streptomyces albofaciens]
MNAASTVAQRLDLAVVRSQVGAVLDEFLTAKARTAAAHHLPGEVTQLLHDFLRAGGKRLRPLLCVTGWHAAAGRRPTPSAVLRTAAALEMFHAFALIHDDIMDSSATRRGRPTVHRALARRHAPGRTPQAADRTGTGAGILIGDVALAWSDELLHTAGLTAGQLTAALPLIDAMRTEVMYGQYLDLTATGRPTDDMALALAIVRYKTAKYTVERPLHIGASLAGAGTVLRDRLSEFALPLGEAFQLRDDLLGVFGDPAVTGKPSVDDLREGKHTALLALALRRAAPAHRHTLRSLIGNPCLTAEDAGRIRHLIACSGAPDEIERMIGERCAQAGRALDRAALSPTAHQALRELARTVTTRTA